MRERRTEEAWCVHNDPCGLCCVCFTYGLIFFADYGALPSRGKRCRERTHSLARTLSRTHTHSHSPDPPWPRSTVVVFALLLPWSGFSAHFFLHTFAFLTISLLSVLTLTLTLTLTLALTLTRTRTLTRTLTLNPNPNQR